MDFGIGIKNFVMRSKKSIKLDRKKRSKEGWERGKKAPKKSNPRYKPVMITDKNGIIEYAVE